MLKKGQQGKRGHGNNSYECWEEIRHLKIDGEEPAFIYKRLDTQKDLPIEERNYQIYIPIPHIRKGVS